MLKRLTLYLFLITGLINITHLAFAISIEPTRIETSIVAGQRKELEFLIGNPKDYPVLIKVSKTNWSMTKEARIITEVEGGMVDWLKLPAKEIEIEAQSSKQIPLIATIPRDAQGEYRAIVFFEEIPKEKTDKMISITTRIGASIYVSAEGTEKVDGKIENIEISKVENKGPMIITVTFRNSGNIHLRPNIIASLKDVNGKWVCDEKGQPIELLINKDWPVLPGKDCTFRKEWKSQLDSGEYLAIVWCEFDDVYHKGQKKMTQKKEIRFKIDKNGTFLSE
jgi:P pilus assembly chaperone PapD